MTKILLVWPPFCTPVSPPYSLASLFSFLKKKGQEVEILDLNLEFHRVQFPEYQEYFQDTKQWKDYEKRSEEYQHITSQTYSQSNKKVVKGSSPELIQELIQKITQQKPDVAAFSIAYSSQAFYALAILKQLKSILPTVTTIIGGPTVSGTLKNHADYTLRSETELLEIVETIKRNGLEEKTVQGKENILKKRNIKEEGNILKKESEQIIPDFSGFHLKDYFTPNIVLPLKTSVSCYYRLCTFCTHYSPEKYREYEIEAIKETVVRSKQKYFFLIDDMVSASRLLKIAQALKPLNVHWTCQLKPTKEFNVDTLKELKESGLIMIMWGVESGNQRILNLMKKGTKKEDIRQVLADSHTAGIKNIAYILFGFPTETEEEFLETVEFLKSSKDNIDLINCSIFGLQKGAPMYTHPEDYGIINIKEEARTVLEPKISYEVTKGLTIPETISLYKKSKHTLGRINKYPHTMNFFREHMLVTIKTEE